MKLDVDDIELVDEVLRDLELDEKQENEKKTKSIDIIQDDTLYLELLENRDKIGEREYVEDEEIPQTIVNKFVSELAREEKYPSEQTPMTSPVVEQNDFALELERLIQTSSTPPLTPTGSIVKGKYSITEGTDPLLSKYENIVNPPKVPLKSKPPKLADLKRKEETPEEAEVIAPVHEQVQDPIAKKRELLYKLNRLRQANPSREIPIFTMKSDLEMMENVYEDEFRNITVDGNVQNYRKILQLGFVAMEFVLGKILKMPMNGFARNEMARIDSYDKLLFELGEKYFSTKQSKIPVEIRLLGLVLMNAVIFAGVRMFTGSVVTDTANIVRDFGNIALGERPRQQPKMRVPDDAELKQDME